jgi:hypothetical protein
MNTECKNRYNIGTGFTHRFNRFGDESGPKITDIERGRAISDYVTLSKAEAMLNETETDNKVNDETEQRNWRLKFTQADFGLLEKLKEEFTELSAKITRLEIAHVTLDISQKELHLLHDQKVHMCKYADVLLERMQIIANRHKAPKETNGNG